MKVVAILGASPERERFAYKAMVKLQDFGHKVILVNPNYQEIEGRPVLPDLYAIKEPVHTLTLYVSPSKLLPFIEDILDLRPQRVIFNPGTETPALEQKLLEQQILVVKACTLVMLDIGKF